MGGVAGRSQEALRRMNSSPIAVTLKMRSHECSAAQAMFSLVLSAEEAADYLHSHFSYFHPFLPFY